MERTYVFNSDGNNGCCGGSKLDITALLPGMFGNRNSIDPNLLLALNNGYNNQNAWGGAGIWWIWILLLFGWGRNGFGGWGGNGCNDGCNNCNALPWALNGDAGRELLMNAIQGNGNAISQLATTLNCDIKSLQTNLCNIQSLIQNVGNQVGLTSQQIINSIQNIGCQIGNQLQQCCCTLQSAIERQGYEGRIATIQQTDEIKSDAASKFTTLSAKIDAQTVLLNDKFCQLEKRELQNKIDTLNQQKTSLETSALLQQQTQNLINQLRPCAVPAYPSCSPYQSYSWAQVFGYPYGYNGYGCGCNNGCNCNNGCSGCGC